jgi:hypothetical protein
MVLLLRADRRDEALRLVDEYLDYATKVTYSVADFALALVLAGRESDFERLPASVRASPWGIPAEALARREWRRAADLFDEVGAHFYAREARALAQGAADAASA